MLFELIILLKFSQSSEYSSTYISVKGGSQEVAAIVANMNQPDFSDSFIGWLQTVNKYPRAFDFKYESIVSILDINIPSLFAQQVEKERKICMDYAKNNCKFGFTIEEFEASWNRKLAALKFAITIYLKEPNGLSQTKFFIEKGNSDCRFNILNYLSPFWDEIVGSDKEFHITFNLITDEDRTNSTINEYYIAKNDEIYFMKREDFWLAKRKGEVYTYKSAKLLKEPFKSSNFTNLINIFGLVLQYNEKDATISVVNMTKVLNKYSEMQDCQFEIKGIDNQTAENRTVFIKLVSHSSTSHSFKRNNLIDSYQSYSRVITKRQNKIKRCKKLYKNLLMSTKNLKNLEPFWIKLWQKVVGVVDYVDPIQAVLRTWDLKYAVLPCQLKWSNNLMMVLSKEQESGKCLKFTAATEGELFVVIATTPSDQDTWYIFQITTKGVIFYKVILIFNL